MIYRMICAALIAPLLIGVASAAATRTVRVQNETPALIDVGWLQPPSSTTLSRYGTLLANTAQPFKLDEGEAKVVVKSSACHGSSSMLVPQRATTVIVESGCNLLVR
ncbi:MAG TPA: hypothetical protein VMF11_14080 [Candidatus Baltobacteraceae bacterium]|nr:hypothetical protein [Candidatus Baltobacteraceae bacterium]